MRNKNKSKRKWTPAALACALAVMAMLAAAPAWAYQAFIRNDTDKTVKVEVYEMKFLGVIKPLGKKMLEPGMTLRFHTNGANCIDHYEGWYLEATPSTGTFVSQHWEKKANPDGIQCAPQLVHVKRNGNGKFYFEKQ